MPLYRFKISDTSGKVSETIVEAENQKEAVKRLRARKAVVLDFLGDARDLGERNKHVFKRHRFDPVDFTDRLVPLLEAGITLEKSLQILSDATENPDEKNLINDLRRGLHEGRPFSKLIRDRGKLFPRIYSSIVEAGEESGALAEVMAELRRFMISSKEMKSFLISSSIYPVVVLVVSVCVVLFMMGVIVPKFASVFQSSGKTIPPATQFLISSSELVGSYWWLSLVAAGGVLFFIRALQTGGPIKTAWDRRILKVPLIGRVVHYSNLSRMLRTMSVLMKSGVHLLDTVTISSKVIDNSTLRNSISFLTTDLRKGEKLSVALSKSEYIPPMVTRMLAVGEETGQPGTMMGRIAERFEEEVKKRLKKVIALFEPLMILFLAFVVGAILVIMFMSIMDMQSSF